MPDKHEVGGSTPLEPTTQSAKLIVRLSQARKLKRIVYEARERIRKPESK